MKRWVHAVPLLLMISLALARAGSGGLPARSATPSTATLKTIWGTIAAAEPELRRNAAKSFPGDPWSQDDDFHNAEQRLVRELAQKYRIALQDVLLAIDLGIRERWPIAGGVQLKTDVPPCHPRPFYD